MLYQEGKTLGLHSFVAGIISGVLSTAFTHPLEIVRAELQSYIITQNELGGIGIAKQLKILAQTGEAFRGLAPRLIKKPLTNTLAFLLFETMEDKYPIKRDI
jgi:hypothetical protein